MTEILDDLKSAHWWMGVVFVGLAINLASAYLKPWLDSQLARISKRRKDKLLKESEKKEILIKRLQEDEFFLSAMLGEESRCRLMELNCFVAAGIGFSSIVYADQYLQSISIPYRVVMGILLFAVMALGLDNRNRATKIANLLRSAHNLS